MKILTVNCTYREYSTGKIINDIEEVLASKNCSFVHCYEVGELYDKYNVYRLSGYWEYRFYYVLTQLIGLQYGGGIVSNKRLISILKREKPDIVHIHCPNAFSVNLYRLLNYLKTKKIKTVITNHAEFFFTGNCAHAEDCKGYLSGCKNCDNYRRAGNSMILNRTATAWNKMRNAFWGFKNIYMVAVSPWSEVRIKNSVICRNLPSCTILNGIDTDNVFYSRECKKLLKYKDTDEQKIFLHVTSHFSDDISDPKGGVHLLRLAELLQQKHLNCKILVVGPLELQKNYDYLNNIIFLGRIEEQNELAQFYSMADLTIMTSKRETFGLTCAESMCCGTPVIGFKNGGTETIAIPEFSAFSEYGDVKKLEELLFLWMDKKQNVSQKLEKVAQKIYSKKTMALNYYSLYCDMMKEANND